MAYLTVLARRCAQAVLLLACTSAAAVAADKGSLADTSQDSVSYQINAGHTGDISFWNGFSGTLTQLWSVNLGGAISYPITANGVAFVTVGSNGSVLLVALKLSTGAIKWEKLLPGGSWADAAYDGDKIFVINSAGILIAFNATSGRNLWSVQVPGGQGCCSSGYSAPVAYNGAVLVQYQSQTYYTGIISAFDETTGATRWTSTPASYSNASTQVSGAAAIDIGGYRAFFGNGGGVYEISLGDGATIWNSAACYPNGQPSDSPALIGAKLYVPRINCSSGIFDRKTGDTIGNFVGTATPVALGRDTMVSLGGVLYDYSSGSYNVKWRFAGDGTMNSKPIVINGYVAALSGSGNLYMLDGSTGQRLWTANVGAGTNYGCCGFPDSGLGAGEGVLLVPSTSGSLFAFAPVTTKQK